MLFPKHSILKSFKLLYRVFIIIFLITEAK